MGGRGASGPYIDHLAKEGNGSGGPPIDITHKYKGLTLEQTEKKLRGLKHEEAVFFDKDGNVVVAYKGNAGRVGFDASLRAARDLTLAHGHPKGAGEYGGTFSFGDMKNMLSSNWRELRATASGQGEMNYILRRTAKSDSKGFYKDINQHYTQLTKRMKKAHNAMYDAQKKAGASESSARHAARQAQVGVLNSYYKKTAEKYGFEYITRKKNYKYGR